MTNRSNGLPDVRWLLSILYGLLVMWTGLLRSIQAQEFKPNAFYFCLTTGLVAIAAGYLLHSNRKKLGTILGVIAAGIVLAFYVHCFITQPDKDATYRVAIAILASVGQLCAMMLPVRRED